jgi:hypothetical protein
MTLSRLLLASSLVVAPALLAAQNPESGSGAATRSVLVDPASLV